MNDTSRALAVASFPNMRQTVMATPEADGLLRLAAAVRRLVDITVSVQGPAEPIREAAIALEEVAARLAEEIVRGERQLPRGPGGSCRDVKNRGIAAIEGEWNGRSHRRAFRRS